MSMSEPSGVVVPFSWDSSGRHGISLQKTSSPALEIDDGAVTAALLLVVVAAFLLLPPHPAARRTSRRTRAPTGAVSLERDTAELLSLISLAKIRLSDLLVAEKRRGLV